MHLPTHVLSGWAVATLVPGLTPRERALAMVAATAPDLDGLALLAGREAFETLETVAPSLDRQFVALARRLPFGRGRGSSG